MNVLLLLALLQQTGWETLRARREMTAAELEGSKTRLTHVYTATGVRELADLAKRLDVVAGEDRPVIHLQAATLVETRRLERTRQPFEGGEEWSAKVTDIDLWKVPSPTMERFANREFRIPIADSSGVVVCGDCRGTSVQDCPECGRKGRRPCLKCKGRGSDACKWCNGSGGGPCPLCGGAGFRQMGANRIQCIPCRSTGKNSCGRCESGQEPCSKCEGAREMACEPCQGKGTMPCKSCGAVGRMIESLQLVIEMRSFEDAKVFTGQEEPWVSKVPAPDQGWLTADAASLKSSLAKIADEKVRSAIASFAEGVSGVKGARVKNLRLRVAPVSCFRVRYKAEGVEYEAVVTPASVFEMDSPLRRWSGKKAAEARERLVRAGDRPSRRARELAELALKADGECVEARKVLDENGARLKVGAVELDDTAEKPAPVAAAPSAPAPAGRSIPIWVWLAGTPVLGLLIVLGRRLVRRK